MSYLAFKEKMNSFKNDDFQKRKFFDQLQVFFVAGFWIVLTVGLLYYDYSRKQNERASFVVPITPSIEQLAQFPSHVSKPETKAMEKQ